MIKCSPVVMRQSLRIVEMLKDAGITFVPVPVDSAEEYEKLLERTVSSLEALANEAEKAEKH